MGNPLTAAAQKNSTSPTQTTGCKFCGKQGLLIWPMRYGVLGETKKDCLTALPDISGTLPNAPSIKLTHSRYAVRTLRKGYLYLLVDRNNVKRWQGYSITEDGYLNEFPVASPPSVDAVFTCSPDKCGLNASMVAIEKPEEVANAYFLFTPDPLTVPMLDLYSSKAVDYAKTGKMQAFKPKDWVTGSIKQPHSLTTAQIPQTLAELVVESKSTTVEGKTLGEVIKNSFYPTLFQNGHWMYVQYQKTAPILSTFNESYFDTLAAKAATTRFTKQHAYLAKQKEFGAAFVINDPIGITQELNDIRNDAFTPVQKFLDQKDKYRISNDRKLQIAEEIDNLKVALDNNAILRGDAQSKFMQQGLDAELKDMQNASAMHTHTAEQAAKMAELNKKYQVEKDAAVRRAVADAKKNWEKCVAKIDMKEIERFRQQLEAISKPVLPKATLFFDDHVAWLQSNLLIDAFDAYDKNHIPSGACFCHQVADCLLGMSGLPAGAALIDQWAQNHKPDPKNLLMRAYAQNQDEIEQAIHKNLTELKLHVDKLQSIDQISNAIILKTCKGTIDGFKKADSAFEAWEAEKTKYKTTNVIKDLKENGSRSRYSAFYRLDGDSNKITLTASAKRFFYISEFTRSVFRLGLNKADKWVTASIGALLYSHLGKLTEQLEFETQMLKFDPNNPKCKAGYKKRSAEKNLANETQKAEQRASEKAKIKAEEVEGSLDEVLEDAKKKAASQAKTATSSYAIDLDAPDTGQKFKREINSYHQVRIGLILSAIELIAISDKVNHYHFSVKATMELTGSVLSLTSIMIDTIYTSTKSLRELDQFSAKNAASFNKAADITRGRLKLYSGRLSAGAGMISAVMDFWKFGEEYQKRHANRLLLSIYVSRGAVSAYGAWLGLQAAKSYGGSMLARNAKLLWKNGAKGNAVKLRAASMAANKVAESRALLLIRVARFNWIGLGLTAAEIILRVYFFDNDLENWCDRCSFRLDKDGLFSSRPDDTVEEEIADLHESFASVA